MLHTFGIYAYRASYNVCFYMRLGCNCEKFPSDPKKCCMINQRVGINMLKNILSELSEKAGLYQ